jgi:MarR family 2-MHQ and catechol resistance regulon transcriptional repressor
LTRVKPFGTFEQVKRTDLDGAELSSIMRAWGRQQLAFSDETMHFFMDVDLTMSQFRALVMIRRWGPQTGRELARRLHVTPGSLVPLVDRLEQQGYLRRVPDEEDRRLTWLELTPKADRLFKRLWGMGAARIAAAISRLVPRDRAELRRILTRVAEHLEAAGSEPESGPGTASA